MPTETDTEKATEASREPVQGACDDVPTKAAKVIAKRTTKETANGTKEIRKTTNKGTEAKIEEISNIPIEAVIEEDSGGIFVYAASLKYANESGRAKLFVSHALVPHLATKNNAHKTQSFCWWVNVPSEASKLIGEKYYWPNKALTDLRDIVNPTKAASSKSGGINMYKELCLNKNGTGVLKDHPNALRRLIDLEVK